MPHKILIAFAALAFTAACGGSPEQGDAESDDVTATGVLYTVQKDTRRCPAPGCGGYWVQKAFATGTPAYATTLDLSNSGLDAATAQAVLAAPTEELVLRGRFSPDRAGFKLLSVTEAYRGMPGVVPAAKDVLYGVADRVPARQCVTAPCNNQIATRLADGKASDLTRVAFDHAAKMSVDLEWLGNRVARHGAMVSAHTAAGKQLTGGAEAVLDASQVWVRLADVQPSCPAVRESACAAGEVHAYDRTAERCYAPLGCVKQQACARSMIACADGYVRASWTSAQGGCPAYACDPAWSVAQ